MKLTQSGSIKEELKEIPRRNWWKYTFLVPLILFVVIGVIGLFDPEYDSRQYLLFGILLLLNHLSASFLNKQLHRQVLGFVAIIIAVVILFI